MRMVGRFVMMVSLISFRGTPSPSCLTQKRRPRFSPTSRHGLPYGTLWYAFCGIILFASLRNTQSCIKHRTAANLGHCTRELRAKNEEEFRNSTPHNAPLIRRHLSRFRDAPPHNTRRNVPGRQNLFGDSVMDTSHYRFDLLFGFVHAVFLRCGRNLSFYCASAKKSLRKIIQKLKYSENIPCMHPIHFFSFPT